MTKLFQQQADVLAQELEAHQQKAAGVIEGTMRKALGEWQKRFPKRRVSLLDAMGSISISVDGKAVNEDWGFWNEARFDEILAPLREALAWYIEVSDLHNICVEFALEPLAEGK